ncbi:MAG: elongation factor 4, partial [Candidatus Ryanbacteria bacterium]|nr:elongation factor 4 [Candidatus Ryanbacteria bacterium]
ATQGIEAQTLSHFFVARKLGLTLIPVINKIDLSHARVEEVERELHELAGFDPKDVYKVSAKEGTGVEALLEGIVRCVPPPKSSRTELRALVFDSFFESHKGIVAYVRVMDGELKRGERLWLAARAQSFSAKDVGYITPALLAQDRLSAGDVGFVVTGIKESGEVRVGDTIIHFSDKAAGVGALPGYLEPKPVVWASFFPTDQGNFFALGDALSKLKLNDSSLVFEEKSSMVLGRGYECGFLGTLHLEISAERLRREFHIEFVVTHPSVTYRITHKGIEQNISSPALFPDRHNQERVDELWMKLEIIAPQNALADAVKVAEAFEGVVGDIKVVSGSRLTLEAEMPLRQMIAGFFDALKSATHGYASYSYEEAGWREADLVRIQLLVAGEVQEALARVALRASAEREARKMVERVKSVLPQELFIVKIQAEVEGRIIASDSLRALRKDVTGYLYGGDRSRKMKLWKKQKAGKKRLQEEGRVMIQPETYLKLISKESS